MKMPVHKEDSWNGERMETNIYNQVVVEHLHRYAIAMEFIHDKNVLDLASGEGYGSNLMATVANSVTGVDISEEAVNHARNKYHKDNLKFLQGSADNVPVESNSIDVVVSFETIEHHEKHQEMLLEIKRVLKHDGILIMSSPDKLNYSDIRNYQNPYHVKELYIEEFKELINKYFKNYKMLFQKIVYGSLICPESEKNGFTELLGDYNLVSSSRNISNPMFDICIASDAQINTPEVSFFNGQKALEEMGIYTQSEAEKQVKSSVSYKVGYLLTQPFRLVKNFFKS